MGWLFGRDWETKQQIVKHLTVGWENATRKVAIVEHTLRGNHLWMIMEMTNKETGKTSRTIGLALLQKQKDMGWGYKDMDETMGPCYYTCPLSYLSKVPDPRQGCSTEWRARLVAKFTQKKEHSTVTLKAGDSVAIDGGGNYTLVATEYRGSKRSVVVADNGGRYRIARNRISLIKETA